MENKTRTEELEYEFYKNYNFSRKRQLYKKILTFLLVGSFIMFAIGFGIEHKTLLFLDEKGFVFAQNNIPGATSLIIAQSFDSHIIGSEWVITRYAGDESSKYDIVIVNRSDPNSQICFTSKTTTDPSKIDPQVTLTTGDSKEETRDVPVDAGVVDAATIAEAIDNADPQIDAPIDDGGGVIIAPTDPPIEEPITDKAGYCYTPTTEEYLKLGSSTIILEYQDIKTISYIDSWSQINTTLYKDIGGLWDNTVNSIWINASSNNYKFGANDFGTSSGEVTSYKYKIESSLPLVHTSNLIYSVQSASLDSCGVFQCNNEKSRDFDLNDICKEEINNTIINETSLEIDGTILFDPECSFALSEDSKTLEVIFKSRHSDLLGYTLIDPTVTINDVGSYVSTLSNVTQENNFSHLTIGSNTVSFINSSNLGLYLPFDTNLSSTKTYDYSTNNNDGTYTNGVFWNSSGHIGGSAQFDGVNDLIDIPTNPTIDIKNAYSLSVWVKRNTVGSQYILSKDRNISADIPTGYGFYFLSDDTLDGFFANGTDYIETKSSASYTNTSKWYYLVFTHNGTTQTLYVDGVSQTLLSGGSSSQNPASSSNNLSIGAYSRRTGQWFKGLLDEVMILNISLNSSQVLSLYNNQSSRFFPRGEQVFNNINVSGAGTENTINITINSTMWANSMINVSVGSVISGNYSYGSEYAFTNNFVSAIPITTPTNVSLKFIFYSGNITAQFYSPTLENNIVITSYGSSSGNASLISFVLPTYTNATATINTSIPVNISITESNLTKIIFNWNGTNFTSYNKDNLFYNYQNLSSLGESDALVKDIGGYGNNGNVFGAIWNSTAGKYGGAYQFDGIDDYINVSASNSLNITGNNFTISTWVNFYSIATSDKFIMEKGSASGSANFYTWWQQSTGTLFTGYFDGSDYRDYTYLWTPTTNRYYHLLWTLNDTKQSIYIDGVQVNSTARTGGLVSSFGGLKIGSNRLLSSFFNGTIDETKILNRSLSSQEVYEEYASNLQKLNLTTWNLYINQSQNATTGLVDGTYTYQGTATNINGLSNSTDLRTVIIDSGLYAPTILKFDYRNASSNTKFDQICWVISIGEYCINRTGFA